MKPILRITLALTVVPMPNVGTISPETIDVIHRWIEAGAPQ